MSLVTTYSVVPSHTTVGCTASDKNNLGLSLGRIPENR